MSKKKRNKQTTIDPIDYNVGVNSERKEPAPQEKTYPIEALVMINGNIIEVKEVLTVYTDAYRVVTSFDSVKLVFFHAIAFVENGDYNE